MLQGLCPQCQQTLHFDVPTMHGGRTTATHLSGECGVVSASGAVAGEGPRRTVTDIRVEQVRLKSGDVLSFPYLFPPGYDPSPADIEVAKRLADGQHADRISGYELIGRDQGDPNSSETDDPDATTAHAYDAKSESWIWFRVMIR